MKTDIKPIVVVKAVFSGAEPVQDENAKEAKVRLNFCTTGFNQKLEKEIPPEVVAEWFEPNVRAKLTNSELAKYQNDLQPGQSYRLKVTVDSYAMQGGNHGLWFKILDLQKIAKHEQAQAA